MEFSRCCVLMPLHWETLPSLSERLRSQSLTITSFWVRLSTYPDTASYREWELVLKHIREHGEPDSYDIGFLGGTESEEVSVTIRRSRYLDGSGEFLSVSANSAQPTRIVDDVIAFLGLSPDVPRPAKSAFIAHRFDPEGEQAADRLARFLELLGFDVKTGRGFAPGSVGDKVRKRLESQAIVFVVLTPGDETTWLTQESIFAYAKDKPLFVLCENGVTFKPALIGDLEYIPFKSPAVEGAFVPILEGLRELGYLGGSHKT